MLYLIVNFYVLEALWGLLLLNPQNFRKSYEKLVEDLENYKNIYEEQFGKMLFEHTVKCVQSELRHCKHKSQYYIPNFFGDSWYKNYDDFMCYNSIEFNPWEALKAGVELFDESQNEWELNEYNWVEYGGDAWMEIAYAGLIWEKVPNSVFIDHIIDLAHNNDLFILKKTGIFPENRFSTSTNIINFLDSKRYFEFSKLLENYGSFINYDVLGFIERTQNILNKDLANRSKILYYKAKKDVICERATKLVFSYKEPKWGNKHVPIEDISESPYW